MVAETDQLYTVPQFDKGRLSKKLAIPIPIPRILIEVIINDKEILSTWLAMATFISHPFKKSSALGISTPNQSTLDKNPKSSHGL